MAPVHEFLTWPRAAHPPLVQAMLRTAAEDFRVEELMPFVPAGAGEHLWLKVQKRGFDTELVAKQLARLAGVARRDVGFAGMKDRQAVTVQWFSLYLPGRVDPDFSGLPPGVEIQEAARHTRKLKTGGLGGNRFAIVLRDCLGDRAAVTRRADDIRVRGVPNYFGEQRFGLGGDNVERARAMFAGEAKPRDRKLRGIYLSAARSLLFNEVLARRVADGTWERLLDGEAVMLNGRRSFFVPEAYDEDFPWRLSAGDIHPSGPLWGRGEPPSRGAVRALELAVAGEHPELARGLAQAGLEQERRALRVIPRDLAVEWLDAATLRIGFSLPPGSYATVLVRELADYSVSQVSPVSGQCG
ncbi:MAG: tRNA pseudouridine(13) synthase TruD [Gammaproteobacteria bacterium]|nr:tRNA pseudouridine(13) synthase TruD [Gammaproteobacteria bacterium]